MAVSVRQGDTPSVFLAGSKVSRRILQPVLERMQQKLVNLVYSRPRFPAYTSFSIVPSMRHKVINAAPKDIVHLHWVHEGFFTPWSLERLRGPIVWTMHDTWPFTGGCHYTATGCERYSQRCGCCPELCSSREHDLSRLHWVMKKRAINAISPVVVSPSREYARRAQQSGMLGNCRVEVIPNGLDTDVFRPIPQGQARDLLRLPRDEKLILFGAVSATTDPNKGFDLLQQSLRYLQEKKSFRFSAVIFGAENSGQQLPCPAFFLGRLHDPLTLALAYSAADVFVCPSRQENLPNTIMEAMACGTPAAAFAVGGIPDLVEDGVTGLLAEPYDTIALAHAIDRLLCDPDMAIRMGSVAREKAIREYSLPVLAKRYVELYESILVAPEQLSTL